MQVGTYINIFTNEIRFLEKKQVYGKYDKNNLPKWLHAAEFLQWKQKSSYSYSGPIQFNICVHVKSRLVGHF